METPETIHDFWFGTHPDDAVVIAQRSPLWWSKEPATDALMRERFEPVVAQAASGALNSWLATPIGRLSLILLVDQFPRSMYRDTPQAFAFDTLARQWCKEGIAQRVHDRLRPIERVFFYLPLEHSEALADQDEVVSRYRQLVADADPRLRTSFEGFLDFAVRHRDIIARFGRFPHRNRVLGRESTEDEMAFLGHPGSTF